MEQNAIVMKNVVKEFKVLNRHEGLKGSLKDLFSAKEIFPVLLRTKFRLIIL